MVLKWIGAAYLVFIGLRMLGSRSGAQSLGDAAVLSMRQVFLRAFWTNALNPKVALFFLAFLPQFIAPGTAHASWSFLALGLVFTFNSTWVNIGYGVLAAWIAGRMATLRRGFVWMDRIAGALFVGFGLRLAFSER